METNAGLWDRVADLRPELAAHVRLIRQRYRGEPWYVLHDQSNGRFLRFNAAAYGLVGRLDGRLSLDEVRRQAIEDLGEAAPDQREAVDILARL